MLEHVERLPLRVDVGFVEAHQRRGDELAEFLQPRLHAGPRVPRRGTDDGGHFFVRIALAYYVRAAGQPGILQQVPPRPVANPRVREAFQFREDKSLHHPFLSDGPATSISRMPPSEPSTLVASYGI